LPLSATATATAALLPLLAPHAVAQTLVLLLQSARELLELLGGFVDAIVGLLLLRSALDGLVLIPKLVRIELEEVGEIFGVRLLIATTAALLLAALNLIFLERGVGPLQVLLCALFRRKRVGGIALEQVFLCSLHLLGRERQLLSDDLERRVDRRDVALHHATHERLDGLAHSAL
jgi:hypothetical protein